MRHIRIIGGIVAGALLAGGIALAAIPNSVTGTYSVCANKTTGALRAIDTQAGKKCTAAEKLISWQQGVSASGIGAAGGAAVSCVASQRWDLAQCKPTSFRTGASPSSMLFDGTNIWTLNSGANTVTRYNIATAAVATVTVGTHPARAAFDGTNLWVTNPASNSVSRINIATNVVITLHTGTNTNPYGIVFDGTAFWVTMSGSQSLVRFSTTGATLSTLTLTETANMQPYDIGYDGRFLYSVANDSASPSTLNLSEVIRVDPITREVRHNSLPIEARYFDIAIGPTMLYAADPMNGVLAFIDPTTLEVSNTFVLNSSGHASGLAFDGSSVWVAEPDAHAIARVDQLGYIDEFPISNGISTPTGVLFDGSSVWISNGGTNTVQRYTP